MSWRRPRRITHEPPTAPQTGTVVLSGLAWSDAGDPQLSLDCMLGRPDDPRHVAPVHLLTDVPESAWLLDGLLALLARAGDEGSALDVVVSERCVLLTYAGSTFRLARLPDRRLDRADAGDLDDADLDD